MKKPISIISHERSGTHLTIDNLICFFCGTGKKREILNLSKNYSYWDIDHIAWEGRPLFDKLQRYIKLKGSTQILKTHMKKQSLTSDLPENLKYIKIIIENSIRIYVVRDGRDVMSSFHNYVKYYDKYTGTFHQFLNDKVRGSTTNSVERWRDHVSGWLSDDGVLMIKFEEMLSDQSVVLEKISKHCNLTRNNKAIRPIKIIHSRNLRFALRMLGLQKSSAVLPGNGCVNKWQQKFSQEDKALFKHYAGELLIRLGYESDDNW